MAQTRGQKRKLQEPTQFDKKLKHDTDSEDKDKVCKTVEEMIDMYYREYPLDAFQKFPEFAINKLGASQEYLKSLKKEPTNRTREDIRDWLLTVPFTMNHLLYVGW